MVENPNWQEADLLAICRAQLERQLYWYIRWSNCGEYQQEPRLDSSSSEIHTTKIEGPRVQRTFFFSLQFFTLFPDRLLWERPLENRGWQQIVIFTPISRYAEVSCKHGFFHAYFGFSVCCRIAQRKFRMWSRFSQQDFFISVGMEKKESSQPNKGKEQNNKGIQLCDAISA